MMSCHGFTSFWGWKYGTKIERQWGDQQQHSAIPSHIPDISDPANGFVMGRLMTARCSTVVERCFFLNYRWRELFRTLNDFLKHPSDLKIRIYIFFYPIFNKN
jgi:hypothetical protein